MFECLGLLLGYPHMLSYSADLPLNQSKLPYHHQAKYRECRQQKHRADCLLQAIPCHYILYGNDKEPDQRAIKDAPERIEPAISQILL